MERYSFHDLGINKKGDPPFIPPEAMFIQIDQDFIPLEDLIDGYETLNVSGRELFYNNIDTQDTKEVDGLTLLSSKLPERKIEVKYHLKAKDDYEYREKYQEVNRRLLRKLFNFYFFDDDQFVFTGIVTEVEAPDVARNDVVGSFTITCPSPYKRLREHTTYSFNDSVVIAEPVYYPTLPDEIDIKVINPTSEITLGNRIKQLKLIGEFKENDQIVLKPSLDADVESSITINGAEDLSLLDLNADFENFTVSEDDTVRVNPQEQVTIKLRRNEL